MSLLYFILGLLSGYLISHVRDIKSVASYILNKIYIPTSLQKVSKNVYALSYKHNGSDYKMMIPIKRGPRKVVRVVNENDHDITDDVRIYMGPGEDFHNNTIYPSDLNHQELHFHTRDGQIISCTGNDDLSAIFKDIV